MLFNIFVAMVTLEVDSLKPRKQPMSLASPSIILDEAGNVRMVIGAAGGKYIATALSQVNKLRISKFNKVQLKTTTLQPQQKLQRSRNTTKLNTKGTKRNT